MDEKTGGLSHFFLIYKPPVLLFLQDNADFFLGERMLEYCYTRSQGFPIVMPLIGAGQSRTGNNERAILEYLIGLLKMNKDLIMSDVHIVVRNSGKETIPITEL